MSFNMKRKVGVVGIFRQSNLVVVDTYDHAVIQKLTSAATKVDKPEEFQDRYRFYIDSRYDFDDVVAYLDSLVAAK